MIEIMQAFIQCLFGPDLYQIYPKMLGGEPNYLYKKNSIENLSERIFFLLKLTSRLIRLIWPVCLFYFYRNGAITLENGLLFVRVISSMMILLVYFTVLRGIGRFRNVKYRKFIVDYLKLKDDPSEANRQKFLSNYDFSLSNWPTDYSVDPIRRRRSPSIASELTENVSSTMFERIVFYPMILLGYICVNTFGRRLMFPGSMNIINHMMRQGLLEGRINLIVSYRAKRCLIRTADGNRIDTAFVDRRSTEFGKKLIITCEGNAGFYELGSMMTPIEAGYSVLGWNRPGFSQSSGSPGVLSEINAIDAVIQYAINKLEFSIDNIVLFGWSIGGYAACWTAVHYPDIHGLILDAIFDDVLPLAQRQMPTFTSKFVEKTIRYYLNLNNIQLLKVYNGPLYLIRRTHDEVMNILPGKVESNRANELIYGILSYRYPFIYNSDQIHLVIREYLACKKNQIDSFDEKYCSDKQFLRSTIEEYRSQNPTASYPCNFGENFSFDQRQSFAIYLINQYLINFHSTHCTSLPQIYFFLPNRCV